MSTADNYTHDPRRQLPSPQVNRATCTIAAPLSIAPNTSAESQSHIPDVGSGFSVTTDSSMYGDGSDAIKSQDHDASGGGGAISLLEDSLRNGGGGGYAYSDAQKAALSITAGAMTAAMRWLWVDISTLSYRALGLVKIGGRRFSTSEEVLPWWRDVKWAHYGAARC